MSGIWRKYARPDKEDGHIKVAKKDIDDLFDELEDDGKYIWFFNKYREEQVE